MMLCLLLLGLLLANDVLVMKNGKLIRCESYEQAGSTVTIRSDGNTFSIPASMIDWPQTEEAQAALDAQLQAETEAKRQAAVAEAAQAEQEEIERQARIKKMMAKGIEQSELPNRVDVVSGIRRMGNGLIVAVYLNDQGPYDFLLDTGASKTVVSPSLVAKLNVELTDEIVPLIGVAGKPVNGRIANLESIRVDSAEVKKFPVTVFAIQSLNTRNINGLLGQDYLNHFSVEVNSKKGTLRLRGQQLGVPVASQYQTQEIAGQDYASFNRDFSNSMQGLAAFHSRMRGGSALRAIEWQEIRQIQRKVSGLEGRLKLLLRDLNDSQSGTGSAGFARCQKRLIPLIRTMNRMARTMIGLQSKNPNEFAAALQTPADQWNEKQQDYQACMKRLN